MRSIPVSRITGHYHICPPAAYIMDISSDAKLSAARTKFSRFVEILETVAQLAVRLFRYALESKAALILAAFHALPTDTRTQFERLLRFVLIQVILRQAYRQIYHLRIV